MHKIQLLTLRDKAGAHHHADPAVLSVRGSEDAARLSAHWLCSVQGSSLPLPCGNFCKWLIISTDIAVQELPGSILGRIAALKGSVRDRPIVTAWLIDIS
jgi:hypothetical protein